jgi:hypothetical protein
VLEIHQNSPLCEYTTDEARPSDEAIWYEHFYIFFRSPNFPPYSSLYYLDTIFSDMFLQLWWSDGAYIDHIEEIWNLSFFFEERVYGEYIMWIGTAIVYGEIDIWGWLLGSLGSWPEECDSLDSWESRKHTSHFLELLSTDPVMRGIIWSHWRIGYENLRKVVCTGWRSLARWWASETRHRYGLSRCDSREPWARARHLWYILLRMTVWWHHGVSSRGIPYIRGSPSLSSSWVQNTSRRPVWVRFFLILMVWVSMLFSRTIDMISRSSGIVVPNE